MLSLICLGLSGGFAVFRGFLAVSVVLLGVQALFTGDWEAAGLLSLLVVSLGLLGPATSFRFTVSLFDGALDLLVLLLLL